MWDGHLTCCLVLKSSQKLYHVKPVLLIQSSAAHDLLYSYLQPEHVSKDRKFTGKVWDKVLLFSLWRWLMFPGRRTQIQHHHDFLHLPLTLSRPLNTCCPRLFSNSFIQFGRSAAFVLPVCHVNTSSQLYICFGRVHRDQIQLRELICDSLSCHIIHSRNNTKG